MADSSSDWNQVASSLTGLALKLKMHLAQAGADTDAAEAKRAARDDVRKALESLGTAMDDAFDAMRNAVADPAVKEDVRDVGAKLKDALANTFAQAGDELRDSMGRRRGGAQ